MRNDKKKKNTLEENSNILTVQSEAFDESTVHFRHLKSLFY